MRRILVIIIIIIAFAENAWGEGFIHYYYTKEQPHNYENGEWKTIEIEGEFHLEFKRIRIVRRYNYEKDKDGHEINIRNYTPIDKALNNELKKYPGWEIYSFKEIQGDFGLDDTQVIIWLIRKVYKQEIKYCD